MTTSVRGVSSTTVRWFTEVAVVSVLLSRNAPIRTGMVSGSFPPATARYRRITLWINDVLTSARRLYRPHGFQLVDQDRYHRFGHDLFGQNWGPGPVGSPVT